MKRIFLISALICAVICSSCSESYDDSALRADLNSLEARVAKLEELCRQMNTNISSLQTIVAALQENDYVKSVTPITQNGEIVGYTISFAKNSPITIYHGKDGQDGKDGQNGKDGVDGADGKDGNTPIIGVKQDKDGVYYWTLNGEWLLDNNGKKIKAEGKDGKDGVDGKDGADGKDGVDGEDGKDGEDGADGADGADGTNGTDGVTPKLKIENGYWYISYDNGKTWTNLGKAKGENGTDGKNGVDGKNGDSFFKSVDASNSEYVLLVLADGTEIKLPKYQEIDITFSATTDILCQSGESVEIEYSIIGTETSYDIECWGDGGWSASITEKNNNSGVINITAPDDSDAGKVVVVVTTESKTIVKALHFVGYVFKGIENAYTCDYKANTINIPLQTTINYTVEIPEEDKSWITLADTRADVRNETLTFSISANNSNDNRSSSITVKNEEGEILLTFTISQLCNEFISFADPIVAEKCIAKYDINLDGKLSFKEAEAATGEFGISFKNTEITQFKEFAYFKNIASIPDSTFEDCEKLTEITFPNKLVSIGKRAFNDCNSLKKVILPNNVMEMGEAAFGCDNMTYMKVSDNVEIIETSAISSPVLTTLILGKNLKEIKERGLVSHNLSTLTLPEKVEEVGYRAISARTLTRLYLKNPDRVVGAVNWPISEDEDKVNKNFTICVPTHLVERYKKHQYWGVFTIVGYDF